MAGIDRTVLGDIRSAGLAETLCKELILMSGPSNRAIPRG